MYIEFATMINDYEFPHLSDSVIGTIEESVSSKLLFEKMKVTRRHKRPSNIFSTQSFWRLV